MKACSSVFSVLLKAVVQFGAHKLIQKLTCGKHKDLHLAYTDLTANGFFQRLHVHFLEIFFLDDVLLQFLMQRFRAILISETFFDSDETPNLSLL